jgi:hypothetical protein
MLDRRHFRITRSTLAPSASPASTSVNQCAKRKIRVATRTVPTPQTAFLTLAGNNVAAEANVPT